MTRIIQLILSLISFAIVIYSQNELKPELVVQTQQKNILKGLDFNYNGQILASLAADGTISLWDEKTRRLIRTFAGADAIAFSPTENIIASSSQDNTIILMDITNGAVIYSFKGHTSSVYSLDFNRDGTILVSGSDDKTIRLWNVKTGQPIISITGLESNITCLDLSPDGLTLAVGSRFSDNNEITLLNTKDGTIKHKFLGHKSGIVALRFLNEEKLFSASNDNNIKGWDIVKQKEEASVVGNNPYSVYGSFSKNGYLFAGSTFDGRIEWVDFTTGKSFRFISNNNAFFEKSYFSFAFDPNGKKLVAGRVGGEIRLWDVKTGDNFEFVPKRVTMIRSVSVSNDNNTLASIGGGISLWSIGNKFGAKFYRKLRSDSVLVMATFSPNDKKLVSVTLDNKIILWDLTNDSNKTIGEHSKQISFLTFAHNSSGKQSIISQGEDNLTKIWDLETGNLLETLDSSGDEIKKKIPQLSLNSKDRKEFKTTDFSEKFKVVLKGQGNELSRDRIVLFDRKTEKEICTLISIDQSDWIVISQDGRFDTNKDLTNIDALHWILPNQPLTPAPLDIFMRQYYEPNLFPRLLKCTEENNCPKEFKPLPSIAEINRVQPNVRIKEIKPVANSTALADVTIEIENVTDEVSLSATDKTQKKQLSSGVYDLRLFRDRQLVGVSTPKDKLEKFIADAPRLVEENKKLKKLIDTPEDQAWREANDIFQIKAENVKLVSPTKIEYTFHNVKLPRDGRKEVEFTAYAFNSDKVKSTTTEPFKFKVPETVSNNPKKGRAYLISIGVNASENTDYDLQYAANDAHKMQEIVGSRLKADTSKYSEVVQIPLISDYGKGKLIRVNTAQKAIIKGVFSLLAGNEKEVPAEILNQFPNHSQIKAIEPEDTLIITYAGHGYADQAGIFYLLPYDIGKGTTSLNAQTLQKTISSDELSLWMQNITASEMIMIIDACYSSAAVQGDGFKPGPMGSRGLGQLAYDKDMKILSATQANNVALEVGTLQQGLLSYALLQDGINKSLADVDKDKQMLSTEWLTFAEKRVPELYQAVKDGKLNILIDGKRVKSREPELIEANNGKSNLNLQQPSLFDFKRRNKKNALFNLP